jgi:hypothetical protein
MDEEEEERLGAWIYKQSRTAKLLADKILSSSSRKRFRIHWIQTWGYLFDLLYPRVQEQIICPCLQGCSYVKYLFTVPSRVSSIHLSSTYGTRSICCLLLL